MPEKRPIKVFIASPGDLAAERRAFKNQIEKLNLGFGDGAGVEFVPLGWEDTLAATGIRSQSVINAEIDACDVFILAMSRRWGRPAPDAEPYSSYTEEEFHRALDRWRKTSEAPRVFVFFKHIDAESMADPGPQLAGVLKFRRELEDSREVLYHLFEDESAFAAEVDTHLRAFARDDLPQPDATRNAVVLPIEYRRAVEEAEQKAKALAQKHRQADEKTEAAMARADELALGWARQAAKAADEGRLEEARQAFSMAVVATTNLDILYLAYAFYERTGELSLAEEMLERWLSISGPDAKTAETAAAYGNLGLIYETRGDLEQAEAMHRKSLAIEEKLGRLEGMAADYSNLGLIYQTRGDLEQAEAMHRKALAINEKLGRLEGMAADYGNLGGIYQTRGDLEQAEAMHRKALAINEKLGRLEGMADNYGNLGLIYQTRGDLEQAEAMLRKALTIEEKLGRLEGMAKAYGNLGLIYRARGDLEQAEAMQRKALEIDEKLGRLEGMAAEYANLGLIYKTRGDLEQAVNHWTKSRDLYARIGMPHRVKMVQGWLDEAAGGDT